MFKGVCALCKFHGELCDSHVIPRAITRKLRKDFNGKSIQLDSGNGDFVHNCSKDHSEYLLCNECEKIIGKYERYGIDFFRGKSRVIFKRKVEGVTFSNIDYSLLRQYLISLIWRASAAKGKWFNQIFLPPLLEDRARISLLQNKPLNRLVLGCTISRLNDGVDKAVLRIDYKELLMRPFVRRYENTITCCFIIEGWFLEFFTEPIQFNKRRFKGLFSKSTIQIFPYVCIFDLPEIMEVLRVSENKRLPIR